MVAGAESSSVNTLTLVGVLTELSSPRYTPAGVPVLDAVLSHESTQVESGQERAVVLKLKTISFGSIAEALARQALGTTWVMTGFLTNTRNGKGVVLHVQDFKPI